MCETKCCVLLIHELWLMNQVNKQLFVLVIVNHVQIPGCIFIAGCEMCNMYEEMQDFFY
jgi:hypothetical protein